MTKQLVFWAGVVSSNHPQAFDKFRSVLPQIGEQDVTALFLGVDALVSTVEASYGGSDARMGSDEVGLHLRIRKIARSRNMTERSVYHIMSTRPDQVEAACASLFSTIPVTPPFPRRVYGTDCPLERIATLGHMCGRANIFPAVEADLDETVAINAALQFQYCLRREFNPMPQPPPPPPGWRPLGWMQNKPGRHRSKRSASPASTFDSSGSEDGFERINSSDNEIIDD